MVLKLVLNKITRHTIIALKPLRKNIKFINTSPEALNQL